MKFRLLPLAATLAAPLLVSAQVTINEINAAPNERALRWDSAGQPRLGTGPAWFDTAFDASSWLSGPAPLGFNAANTGLGTNLKTSLDGKTASLYARKTFTVSAQAASSTDSLRLRLNYNDGFVAFLNGKEVARARLGPAKMFVYADQPAFSERPASPSGAIDHTLGTASSLLVPGENVLAIQVANASWDGKGDLILDAALDIVDSGTGVITQFSENFSNANGASRTHTNNAGTISNSVTGSLPAGWLANSPNPVSDASWAALSIAQTLDASGGKANGGNLRLNLTGTAPTQPARVLGPAINMAPHWAAGAVTADNLDASTLSFSFKAPAGFSANVLLEPVGGSSASALSLGSINGTPKTPTSDVAAWWRFEGHSVSGNSVAGSPGAVISNAPSEANSAATLAASVNSPRYSADVPGTLILDPVTGGIRTNSLSFDATAAAARFSAPDNPVYNTASFTIEGWIKLGGEPNGFDSFLRRTLDGPNSDSSTSSDRQAYQVDFSHANTKTDYGKIRTRWDTVGTAPSPVDNNRVAAGNFILVDNPAGDGIPANYGTSSDVYTEGDQYNDAPSNVWHHFAVTYDGASKRVTIYTDYVAGSSMVLNNAWNHPAAALEFGKFSTTAMPAPASAHWPLLLDEVRYTGRVLSPAEMLRVVTPDADGFTTFTASLGSASETDRNAFLAALNGASSTSFRPAFELTDTSYAASPGRELRLDDVSVTTPGSGGTTFFGLGSSFQYFPGAGEPSNGVWEPNLPKIPNNPSESTKPAAFPDLPGFADWVELRNHGTAPVDLTGWFLSDDAGNPSKWAFPAGTTIPASGYLLVLCDENSSLTNQVYLHSNFKLSEGGERVVLYQGATKVDEINYPRVDPFTTYGRSSAGGSLGYFSTATPAAANGAPTATERCKTPDFFAADGVTPAVGGFFTGSQTLVITTPTVGAQIRYTTDGSEPTATSTLYSAPLTIAAGANDKTGRVIRAKAFKAGSVASGVKSATFLINQNAALKGVPALCYTGDATRSFYKNFGVLAVSGGTYDADGEWEDPGTPEAYSMARMHGRAFERPIFVEWLRNDGVAGFAEEAGLRFAASPYSRPRMKLTGTANSPWAASSVEKPSFNLFFREDYGSSTLSYPFLGQGYPVKDFDQLRPRAGKNDISNPFIKDELVRRLFNDMGRKAVKGQINTLYLNGIYKGFYNTVERYREPYFQAHYGSDQPWDIRIIDTVEEGDATEWNNLITAVNQNLTVKANYDAAIARLDLDACIDYYLLNIYMATWDWPNNNWVAAREKSTEGKWRLHIWDAEGAFGNSGAKPPNYDTILTDLRTDAGIGTKGLSQLFRGIYASPEVRLRFADRINHWFFNGNVLDDRTPTNCHIQRRKDEMKAVFAPLLTYTHGFTFNEAFWNNWTTATTANPNAGNWKQAMSNRRSHLFNTNPTPASNISFRTHGLWPATEPVTFSKHGGNIAPGFTLTMATNATVPAGSTVHYTLDGSDPRAWGGAVAAGALTYTGARTLPAPFARVSARVRNGTTGEWSALTTADFLTDTQPATAANLTISQIHYHPSNPTAAETAAGFTSDDEFEFIELMAIGSKPVDLTSVKFVAGISFDFTAADAARVVLPGERVLLVKNRAAFQFRHGTSHTSRIAGEFLGSLVNSGEQLWLTGADGADAGTTDDDIKRFSYDDKTPWPLEPDGTGPSLVLINPSANPDPALPANWRASAGEAGSPGTGDSLTYSAWAGAASDPVGDADPDGDGLKSLLEYFLGSDPATPGTTALPASALQTYNASGVPESFLTLSFTRPIGRDEATFEVQSSSDLSTWAPAVHVSTTRNPGGTETFVYRSLSPANTGQFMRLVVTKP